MKKEELERFNEWWSTGTVRDALAPAYHRRPFESVSRLLGYRQAVVLTGLRRVGKSTILYQLIRKIIQETEPSGVLYFSFEERGEGAKEVLEAYERTVLKKPLDRAGKVHIMLDEVQYSRDWLSAVKRYYDLYPNVKFYLSGSSSLLVSGKTLESLAGRFFFVEVYPMSFREFAEARGDVKPGGEPTSRLEPIFHDYLAKSGFPEVAGWEDEERVAEYVRNSVVDRVLLRDFPALLGARDTLLLGRLFAALVSRPGGTANLNELSREFGASRITVARYLRSLERSFLLRGLANFRPSIRSSSRKLRRYYPATTSLIRAVSRQAFQRESGGVLETYVINALGATHYYRQGRVEVDAILGGGDVAVEVKSGADERDVDKLARAATRIGSRKRMIVSLSDRFSRKGVEVVPAYALEWETPVSSMQIEAVKPSVATSSETTVREMRGRRHGKEMG